MRSAPRVEGRDRGVAHARRRALAATSAVGWPRATSSAKLGPREHADARRRRRPSRAISWPSRPVPVLEALAQPEHGRVGRRGRRAACASSPAIGVATTTRPPPRVAQRGVEVGVDLQRRRQRDLRAGSGRCARSDRICAACAGVARPQRESDARAAAWTASAVPQAPAPSTVMFIARRAPSARRAQPSMLAATPEPLVARRSAGRACGLLRLVHRLEVDFGSSHRREAGARADVGDDRAQVGVDDAAGRRCRGSASAARRGMLRISKMPACLASTRNSVLSLTLVVTVAVTVTSYMPSATGSAPSAEVDLDLRLPLLEQDRRRVRLLERQVLQVDALDLEHGVLWCRRPWELSGSE